MGGGVKSIWYKIPCVQCLFSSMSCKSKHHLLWQEQRAVLHNQGTEGDERVRKNTHCSLSRKELLSAAMSKKTAEVTALLPPCPAGSLTCLEAVSKTTGKAGFVSNTAGWWPYTQDDRMLLSSQVMMGQFIFIGMSREGEPVWSTLQQQDTVKGNFAHVPHTVITHSYTSYGHCTHPVLEQNRSTETFAFRRWTEASAVRIFNLPYSSSMSCYINVKAWFDSLQGYHLPILLHFHSRKLTGGFSHPVDIISSLLHTLSSPLHLDKLQAVCWVEPNRFIPIHQPFLTNQGKTSEQQLSVVLWQFKLFYSQSRNTNRHTLLSSPAHRHALALTGTKHPPGLLQSH